MQEAFSRAFHLDKDILLQPKLTDNDVQSDEQIFLNTTYDPSGRINDTLLKVTGTFWINPQAS